MANPTPLPDQRDKNLLQDTVAKADRREWWWSAALVLELIVLIATVIMSDTIERRVGLRNWMGKTFFGAADGTKAPTKPRDGLVVEIANPAETPVFGEGGRVRFGEFHVPIYNLVTRQSILADFELNGKTTCETKESFDKLMKRHNRFFREQVIVTLRNASYGELDDPDSRIIEKKIAARVNRALGQDFLESVDLKGFKLTEVEISPLAASRKKREPPAAAKLREKLVAAGIDVDEPEEEDIEDVEADNTLDPRTAPASATDSSHPAEHPPAPASSPDHGMAAPPDEPTLPLP